MCRTGFCGRAWRPSHFRLRGGWPAADVAFLPWAGLVANRRQGNAAKTVRVIVLEWIAVDKERQPFRLSFVPHIRVELMIYCVRGSCPGPLDECGILFVVISLSKSGAKVRLFFDMAKFILHFSIIFYVICCILIMKKSNFFYHRREKGLKNGPQLSRFLQKSTFFVLSLLVYRCQNIIKYS